MTKIEMEKPVVSKELAEIFEEVKEEKNYPSEVCDAYNYNSSILERDKKSSDDFEKLLIDMYALGYEIEKPKLKYIRFNPKSKIVEHDSKLNYLNLLKKFNLYRLSCKSQTDDIQTQFTQSEVDDFLKDEPKCMWVVEEVEDQ